MSIAVSIVGLAFLIVIHEAGHFFVALAVKMRPRRFYLFFPPALVKRVRNGIEYGIGAIPLGGYVKIPGMHRPAPGDVEAHLGRALEEAPWLDRHAEPVKSDLADGELERARTGVGDLRAAVERAELSEAARRAANRGLVDLADGLSADAYWRAPAWKRVAVIVAGPATNLVFAVALLAVVFVLGVPVDVARGVERVGAGTPAAQAGLRAGDEIVAVDGRPVTATLIAARIRASEGRAIALTVLRDGSEVRLRPVRPVEREGAYRLGFELEAVYESYGPVEAVERSARSTWRVTEAIGSSLGRIVTGSGRDEVASPVGIVQGSSQAYEAGFRYYLQILAFISLSLALLNLLPLLPLDGGHIAFSVIEKLRGRTIPREAYERASAIGIALVLILFVIGLTNDINRLN